MKPEIKPTHTPTPWKVQRKPLSNVAINGDKDTFRIMEGDKVIASIPRSWKAIPTAEDLACGAEPVATRTAKQAEDLAAFIVHAVNAYERLVKLLKEEHDGKINEQYGDKSFKHKDKPCDVCAIIARAEGR